MSNERIVSGGIITPKLVLGTQSTSGTINFDPSINSVVVNANLKIVGDINQVTTTNSQLQDNMILLNAGQTGSSISAGSAGLEIDRGPAGSRIKWILVEAGDLQSYWISTNAEGNGIAIRSINAPSNSQDLTNKSYVDTTVANAASTLLGTLSIDSLNDVTITGAPSNGQVLAFTNGQWRNVNSSGGGGITSVGISAPSTSILVSGVNPITSSGTISLDLPTQPVTANDNLTQWNRLWYNSFTVDTKGRIVRAITNSYFQTVQLWNVANVNKQTITPIVPDDYLILKEGYGISIDSYDPDSGPGWGAQFSLQNSGVTAGTYSNPTLTVDQAGRITSVTTGAAGGVSIGVPTGTSISNKNSISFNSSNSTLTINGTTATNISFSLPALIGGGSYRGRGNYFQFDQYGRLTGITADATTTANFASVETDSGTYDAPSDAASFSINGKPGSGITTEVSGSQILIGRSSSGYDIPRYQTYTTIGTTSADPSYIKANANATGGYSSFGDIYFASSGSVAYQSKLFEMKLNVTTATTINGFVAWSDDNATFILNGTVIAGDTSISTGQKNLNVTWNLVPGLNTVQICCVNSGGQTMDMNYMCNFFDGNSTVTYAGP